MEQSITLGGFNVRFEVADEPHQQQEAEPEKRRSSGRRTKWYGASDGFISMIDFHHLKHSQRGRITARSEEGSAYVLADADTQEDLENDWEVHFHSYVASL